MLVCISHEYNLCASHLSNIVKYFQKYCCLIGAFDQQFWKSFWHLWMDKSGMIAFSFQEHSFLHTPILITHITIKVSANKKEGTSTSQLYDQSQQFPDETVSCGGICGPKLSFITSECGLLRRFRLGCYELMRLRCAYRRYGWPFLLVCWNCYY